MDRVLINSKLNLAGKWRASATPRKNSDHRGLLLNLEEVNWGPKPFRIFNIWLKDKMLMGMIREELEMNVQIGRDLQDFLRAVKQVTKS